MPSLHDARLLSNLLKTEKDSAQAFKQYTLAAQSASAALSAWSVADSTGTGDLMDAAIRISQLLSTITDSQRLYLTSLTTYRSSLKDVLAREQALRTVVRDREILVNRLIKIGNKRPKDGGEREHEAKLEDAQRELQACETFLQEEELALAHAKRRSFREALNARMQAMNALSHVMDDCSVEAVDILSTLQGDSFERTGADGDVQLRREYDLGSDAGDSIAPSQSASQAMSRASSSSSLSSLNLQQAPPIPHNPQIDSSSRSRTRSTSPNRAAQVPLPASPIPRAKSPARVASTLPPPVMMPPVPSAPPPVSQQVYTERQPGLPTFEIPKAPNLLRRPDESSSDEEDEPYGGLRRNERSSHYPLDSPGYEQPARLRRRAASDTSSVRGGGGGRKRKGSFLGGLASLFRRNKNRDRDGMSVRDFETGGSADYAGARSRLAHSAGGGGAPDGRNDAVMRSVMNAGRVPARRRAGDDSSDDEAPRHLTKHVNDPKARIKALSDVGRPLSPAMPVSSTSAGRPKLQRKGTSASTVRPMSVAGVAGHEAAPRRKKASSTTGGTKKVKKAASDIGVTSSGWKSTAPSASASLQVPKAPSTNGIADLATGVSLPPPPAPINFPSPAFAPRQSGGTPAAPAETGSLRRKKTKKVPAAAAPSGSAAPTQPATHTHSSKNHHPDTVILSAEALGIPTTGAIPQPQQQQGLMRSNTASTQATTIKRKKKKSVVPPAVDGVTANGVSQQQQKALPTADQLAATLPHAVSGGSALNAHLPRPDEDTNAYQQTTKQPRPVSTATITPASTQPTSTQTPANKPIISLAAQEKRSKRLSALHGDANWVQHPPAAAAAPRARGRADVHEGEESLLSVVDRAEGAETVQPSRTYGAPAAEKAVAGFNGGLSPPSVDTPDRSTSSTPQLSKRKSLHPLRDVRPRPGILIQRDPSPVPGSLAASLSAPTLSSSSTSSPQPNWPTRASLRAAMADSSDEGSEGEGMKAYRQARKMLGGRTREMERALTREEKGKGRAE
uniref:Uncharacterized protein n=1 Tax=Rhodotorula toruloides TaxID=5286 RepID=A0A0K3CK34_RHOTO